MSGLSSTSSVSRGFSIRREAAAAGAIAARDVTKLLRDPIRLIGGLVFPALFIGVLGGAFASNFESPGIDLLPFIFAGQLAQGVWQSAALGLISILEDRENDFSQEIFVAPIGRRTILAGKILGESLVAFPQAFTVMLFGIVLGIPLTLAQVFAIIPALILVAIFGASFGALIVSLLPNQRSANPLPVHLPSAVLPRWRLQPNPQSAVVPRHRQPHRTAPLRGRSNPRRILRLPKPRRPRGSTLDNRPHRRAHRGHVEHWDTPLRAE